MGCPGLRGSHGGSVAGWTVGMRYGGTGAEDPTGVGEMYSGTSNHGWLSAQYVGRVDTTRRVCGARSVLRRLLPVSVQPLYAMH